ncbi:multiprotein-bridging factor 1 family protein [Micromonospora sp. NPDC048063]|uniref:helix-turn-helix domain-containing protein n=1 Tax=Micromonospora sp. NPDC048063 TaxID=3364256 RepID=UPI00371B9AE1
MNIARSFGEELRHRRTAAKLSLRTLAGKVPCSVGWLSKMENGVGQPTPTMAAQLDTALHANGALLALVNDQEEGADMQRRAVLRALGAAGLVVTGWGTASHTDLPRRVGPEHVADVVETTAIYRAWVTRHGGAAVRQPAAQLLERAAGLHTAATDSKIRHDLLIAIADLAGLGAYIARDLGAHSSATEHAHLALSAAAAAGSTDIGAHTIVRMAGHSLELRQPHQTLSLLDAAHQRAHHLLTPGDWANQACIRAWAHAQLGTIEQVKRSVEAAENAFASTPSKPSATWAAQHATEAELYSLTGAAFVDLARREPQHAKAAIDRLTRAIELRRESAARNRVLDQISLAQALLHAAEPAEAGRVALQAQQDRTGITSRRLDKRFSELAAELRPHRRRHDSIGEFLSNVRPRPDRTQRA